MVCVVPRMVWYQTECATACTNAPRRTPCAGLAAAAGIPVTAAMPAPQLNGGTTEEVQAAWAAAAPALKCVATMCNARTGTNRDGKRKEKIMKEWEEWGEEFPAGLRPGLRTCELIEVAMFLELWRNGRVMGKAAGIAIGADGRKHITPATLRAAAGTLNAIMAALGRYGVWRGVTGPAIR